ncbi:phosphate ABC transporter permease subunit PstC [Micrococcales bacterium 31B]|nr:phosphate ABC transporter permease subunit PstC [Micrococcales bacterium 31B]
MSSVTETAAGLATASRAKAYVRPGDRIFGGTTKAAAITILAALAAVAAFLLWKSWPAITANGEALQAGLGGFRSDSLAAYVGPLVFGTLLSAVLALILAVPTAIGIALFITHYAPRRLAQTLGYIIDLLAAIPSVVYGLWGAITLIPMVDGTYRWLTDNLGFIPLFANYSAPGRNMMSCAIVLAVMCLPIITAIAREVFLQTPRLHEEAALALGATRWEVIRLSVLPFGRSGLVSATMLALGRALGETMAVAMILSPGVLYSLNILQAGQQQTIAGNIALQFAEANTMGVSTLITTGLVLFVITLVINMAARWIVARRSEFSGA